MHLQICTKARLRWQFYSEIYDDVFNDNGVYVDVNVAFFCWWWYWWWFVVVVVVDDDLDNNDDDNNDDDDDDEDDDDDGDQNINNLMVAIWACLPPITIARNCISGAFPGGTFHSLFNHFQHNMVTFLQFHSKNCNHVYKNAFIFNFFFTIGTLIEQLFHLLIRQHHSSWMEGI